MRRIEVRNDEIRQNCYSVPMKNFTLSELEKRIADRARANAADSYTRSLLDKGVAACARKLGEEAIETGLAAVGESRNRVTAEAADLIYHLLIVLRARGVALKDVEAELGKRTAQSGHAEKASRKKAAKTFKSRR
jgi:phosphoribosyl-ATP pyrophosphohydrolase